MSKTSYKYDVFVLLKASLLAQPSTLSHNKKLFSHLFMHKLLTFCPKRQLFQIVSAKPNGYCNACKTHIVLKYVFYTLLHDHLARVCDLYSEEKLASDYLTNGRIRGPIFDLSLKLSLLSPPF